MLQSPAAAVKWSPGLCLRAPSHKVPTTYPGIYLILTPLTLFRYLSLDILFLLSTPEESSFTKEQCYQWLPLTLHHAFSASYSLSSEHATHSSLYF